MACKIEHFCDRCSSLIDPGARTSYKAVSGSARYGPIIDMCSDCQGKFADFLGPPIKGAIDPAPRRRKMAAAVT